MKKGVILVNVGRGSVLNTNALFKGIKNDIILGAVMDVWE